MKPGTTHPPESTPKPRASTERGRGRNRGYRDLATPRQECSHQGQGARRNAEEKTAKARPGPRLNVAVERTHPIAPRDERADDTRPSSREPKSGDLH
jgi:hypothetical protein